MSYQLDGVDIQWQIYWVCVRVSGTPPSNSQHPYSPGPFFITNVMLLLSFIIPKPKHIITIHITN